jgi:THO complex subunit 2
LDLGLLSGVGLISDRAAFDKKEIRTRTGLLCVVGAIPGSILIALLLASYKQNKFNLLREQSEGYSKLTSELTSSLGPSHSPSTGRPIESHAFVEDRARSVWERVISLIGYFDLDPNRALDIILDVFPVHIATHYSFFLALLSFSPWSASHKVAVTPTSCTPGQFKNLTFSEVLSMAERRSGSRFDEMSSATGNASRVLAQVLGFKFAYYQACFICVSGWQCSCIS